MAANNNMGQHMQITKQQIQMDSIVLSIGLALTHALNTATSFSVHSQSGERESLDPLPSHNVANCNVHSVSKSCTLIFIK